MIMERFSNTDKTIKRAQKNFLKLPNANDRLAIRSFHVETVVLLSQKKVDDYVEVSLELDEVDITPAERKATYQQIQNYVLDKYGAKVSSLYISQIKRKNGLEVGESYNKSKTPEARVPNCPSEKEKYIEEALYYFQMIQKGLGVIVNAQIFLLTVTSDEV